MKPKKNIIIYDIARKQALSFATVSHGLQDNPAISKIVEPKLTTIHYPGIDMGEIAARNLINHLKGVSNIKHTNTIVMRSDLIIRKSSLRK